MKNTKKGFTIVELVIVIAVIAILAAVLIPTFSGIIEKANISSAEQEARNAYIQYAAENADKANFVDNMIILTSKGYYVFIKSGSVVNESEGNAKTVKEADFTTDKYTATDKTATEGQYFRIGETKYYSFKLEGKSLEATEYTATAKS